MKNIRLLQVFSLLFFTICGFHSYTGGAKTPSVYGDEELPAWIFEYNGIIGVSDALMDSVSAVNQAVHRALVLHALCSGTEVGSVYELYYLTEEGKRSLNNDKSHWMASVSATMPNYEYEIVDVYYSKYSEAFVLLSVKQDADSENVVSVSGNLMFYYDIVRSKVVYAEYDTIWMSTPSENVQNSLWVTDCRKGKYIKSSIVDGEKRKIADYGCRYADKYQNSPNMVFSNLKYGFWNAYFDTFIQELTNFESSKKSHENNVSSSFGRKICRIFYKDTKYLKVYI